MVWRARVLGFICGIGLSVSSYTAGVLATEHIDGQLVLDERAMLIYIVGPGAVLLFSVMGWFARGAYNTIDARLRRVEETYVTGAAFKDTIDTLMKQRDRELDLLRDQVRINANHAGGRNND